MVLSSRWVKNYSKEGMFVLPEMGTLQLKNGKALIIL